MITPLLRAVAVALWIQFAVLRTLAAPAPPVSVPRFFHPGAGQTFYFVLTDRFANGSSANDTGGIAGGAEVNGFDPTRISHYHGGDFAGLTARLDYLRHLGVTAVWVTPPFKNKPMQAGTAGYHGYWVLDFLQVDPHLGTNAEFMEFIRQAHARGLKVFMDIIVNHTADVIQYRGGATTYRDKAAYPYRDAEGRAFDERAFAWNGLNAANFPALSAARSFAYEPVVPAAEATAKNPAWLNDVTLYHNRGNSTFAGESAVHGDFANLDDLFTEHPRVVQGFIDVFSHWIEACQVDGFRIDTVKHVNLEFWHAFVPAIRARARALGRPDFFQFGEVYNEAGDPRFLSEFSTGTPLDATLDFGFFAAARNFVSRGGDAAALADFFTQDDYYTDHDSNVHSTTTFLGNHDAGRFGYFLKQDNAKAGAEQLVALVKLGHGLLYLSRGQPIIYYGDEQGMIGRGGGDQQAREDMFGSQAPEFRSASLLGTTRTGADDKFDESHPLFRFFSRLGALRAAHPALVRGAMFIRASDRQNVFAFSRIERGERIEYVVALNNSRSATLAARVPTSQPGGATLRRIFDSRAAEGPDRAALVTDAHGAMSVTLEPLQFAVWRADAPLSATATGPRISFTAPSPSAELKFTAHTTDGQTFSSRQELRAEVTGGDGFAEVTFTMVRASRPGQYELLGTDDAPPYRVFWRPPPDLAPGEKLRFVATVNDLRGHHAVAQLDDVTIAPTETTFGIRGATVPEISKPLTATIKAALGALITFSVEADGTGPLEYQWLRNDEEAPGATAATLSFTASAARAGRYRVLVRNRAGTVLSESSILTIIGSVSWSEKHADFALRHVAARLVTTPGTPKFYFDFGTEKLKASYEPYP